MKNYPAKYVVIGIVASMGIFILDSQLPLGIADGVLYVALVLLGMLALEVLGKIMRGRRLWKIFWCFSNF